MCCICLDSDFGGVSCLRNFVRSGHPKRFESKGKIGDLDSLEMKKIRCCGR